MRFILWPDSVFELHFSSGCKAHDTINFLPELQNEESNRKTEIYWTFASEESILEDPHDTN